MLLQVRTRICGCSNLFGAVGASPGHRKVVAVDDESGSFSDQGHHVVEVGVIDRCGRTAVLAQQMVMMRLFCQVIYGSTVAEVHVRYEACRLEGFDGPVHRRAIEMRLGIFLGKSM